MNPTPCAIQIRGLEKRFSKFHLGPLDLTVPRGSIYAFIGPNGAGKTTTLDLLLQMGSIDAGRITVCGYDAQTQEVEVKRRLGYVSPDLSFMAWKRVDLALKFVQGFYPTWDEAYANRLLESFQLRRDARVAQLSFGERIKLSMTAALAHRPEILLLDEPTTGLDAVSKRQVFAELLAAVRDGERTVLISSHSLTDLERFADHVGMIRKGRLLLEGAMDEVVGRFALVDIDWSTAPRSSGPAGYYLQRTDSNRARALVDLSTQAMEWVQKSGGQERSRTAVTLEEIFVALAQTEAALN